MANEQVQQPEMTGGDYLTLNVLAPHYLNKLASQYGIHANTQEEAVRLLQIGEKLLFAQQQEAVKSASDHSSFLDGVLGNINQAIEERYNLRSERSGFEDWAQKQAGLLANDQNMIAAVEHYQAELQAAYQ